MLRSKGFLLLLLLIVYILGVLLLKYVYVHIAIAQYGADYTTRSHLLRAAIAMLFPMLLPLYFLYKRNT